MTAAPPTAPQFELEVLRERGWGWRLGGRKVGEMRWTNKSVGHSPSYSTEKHSANAFKLPLCLLCSQGFIPWYL